MGEILPFHVISFSIRLHGHSRLGKIFAMWDHPAANSTCTIGANGSLGAVGIRLHCPRIKMCRCLVVAITPPFNHYIYMDVSLLRWLCTHAHECVLVLTFTTFIYISFQVPIQILLQIHATRIVNSCSKLLLLVADFPQNWVLPLVTREKSSVPALLFPLMRKCMGWPWLDTKASLSLPCTTGQGKENVMKDSWFEIRRHLR